MTSLDVIAHALRSVQHATFAFARRIHLIPPPPNLGLGLGRPQIFFDATTGLPSVLYNGVQDPQKNTFTYGQKLGA